MINFRSKWRFYLPNRLGFNCLNPSSIVWGGHIDFCFSLNIHSKSNGFIVLYYFLHFYRKHQNYDFYLADSQTKVPVFFCRAISRKPGKPSLENVEAVFMVPHCQNSEWLYTTPQGHQTLLESMSQHQVVLLAYCNASLWFDNCNAAKACLSAGLQGTPIASADQPVSWYPFFLSTTVVVVIFLVTAKSSPRETIGATFTRETQLRLTFRKLMCSLSCSWFWIPPLCVCVHFKFINL